MADIGHLRAACTREMVPRTHRGARPRPVYRSQERPRRTVFESLVTPPASISVQITAFNEPSRGTSLAPSPSPPRVQMPCSRRIRVAIVVETWGLMTMRPLAVRIAPRRADRRWPGVRRRAQRCQGAGRVRHRRRAARTLARGDLPLGKAIEIDPTYAAAFNDLAVAYEHEGQLDKARDAYEKALEIEPDNTQIRQNYELFKEINDRTSAARKSRSLAARAVVAALRRHDARVRAEPTSRSRSRRRSSRSSTSRRFSAC